MVLRKSDVLDHSRVFPRMGPAAKWYVRVSKVRTSLYPRGPELG